MFFDKHLKTKTLGNKKSQNTTHDFTADRAKDDPLII